MKVISLLSKRSIFGSGENVVYTIFKANACRGVTADDFPVVVIFQKKMHKGPVIIYVGGGGEGGGKSWGGPGLFFLGKRGGPKENFTMIGGGSLCVL